MKKASRFLGRIFRGGNTAQAGVVLVALALIPVASSVFGQGMPLEARKNIHTLLSGHKQVQRELQLADDGYEAVTWSADNRIATTLQEHVREMQERLDRGLAVRRWDPAFAEYRAHYDQIEFKVQRTETGVKVVARGKTPAATKLAQNHAMVIDEFVKDGWTAHDAIHPAVLSLGTTDVTAATSNKGCGRGGWRCRANERCGGRGRGSCAAANN